MFANVNFAATPDIDLLIKAYNKAKELDYKAFCGQVHSSDQFYSTTPDYAYENLRRYGVLCVEMETYGLYMAARKHGKKALGIFTISDSLVENLSDSSENREKSYTNMMKLALEIAE